MSIKVVSLGIVLSLFLSACSSIKTPFDDDYQFGDTYHSFFTLYQQYCLETDPTQRAVYQKIIKRLYGEYPDRGLCDVFVENIVEGDDNGNILQDTADNDTSSEELSSTTSE
jgi:hypothetical protein